jgi:hypothetical protein
MPLPQEKPQQIGLVIMGMPDIDFVLTTKPQQRGHHAPIQRAAIVDFSKRCVQSRRPLPDRLECIVARRPQERANGSIT